jgi:hypothetical protein
MIRITVVFTFLQLFLLLTMPMLGVSLCREIGLTLHSPVQPQISEVRGTTHQWQVV